MSSTSEQVNNLLKVLISGVSFDGKSYPKDLISKSNSSAELKRVLTHMSRIGLIKKEKLSDGSYYLMLTSKGKKRLTLVNLEQITIQSPKKWDGKWRIISFDIPRASRSKRYELLRELHRLGFEKLLQSMWVHPFPCNKEMLQLATTLGIQENLVYLEANLDKSRDDVLRQHFSELLKSVI